MQNTLAPQQVGAATISVLPQGRSIVSPQMTSPRHSTPHFGLLEAADTPNQFRFEAHKLLTANLNHLPAIIDTAIEKFPADKRLHAQLAGIKKTLPYAKSTGNVVRFLGLAFRRSNPIYTEEGLKEHLANLRSAENLKRKHRR